MQKYISMFDGHIQTDIDGDPILFDSASHATLFYGTKDGFTLQRVSRIDRHDHGASFLIFIAGHNGKILDIIDGHINNQSCLTSYDPRMKTDLYADILEQAACNFYETDDHSGVFDNEYAWVVSAR
jgi:hypothetical protein